MLRNSYESVLDQSVTATEQLSSAPEQLFSTAG